VSHGLHISVRGVGFGSAMRSAPRAAFTGGTAVSSHASRLWNRLAARCSAGPIGRMCTLEPVDLTEGHRAGDAVPGVGLFCAEAVACPVQAKPK
jgi:hypothetical protein